MAIEVSEYINKNVRKSRNSVKCQAGHAQAAAFHNHVSQYTIAFVIGGCCAINLFPLMFIWSIVDNLN